MGVDTTIPKQLFKDKKLKDFDIILYLFIAENVNEFGYSKIHNETLTYFTDKGERAIQRAINNLVSQKWLVTKFNVKKNNIYDQDCKRVIWLEQWYRKYNHRTQQAKQKSKTNDFNLFVHWIKTELKGVELPVTIGGLLNRYMVKTVDKKELLHVLNEEKVYVPIDKFSSNDVYKKMFKNQSVIIKWADQPENSAAIAKLTKILNEKEEQDDVK